MDYSVRVVFVRSPTGVHKKVAFGAALPNFRRQVFPKLFSCFGRYKNIDRRGKELEADYQALNVSEQGSRYSRLNRGDTSEKPRKAVLNVGP